MAYQTMFYLLAIGTFAGILSGLIGIGGGIVIVPALVMLLGYSQHLAQGTTLAMMVPPVGILAVYSYYQEGQVDLKTSAILCIGFLVGGAIGGRIVVNIPDDLLKKIFAGILILISIRLFLSK